MTEKVFHLGNSLKPEWKDFTSEKPHHANALGLKFSVKKPVDPLTLEVQSGEVGATWTITVNGREIGKLERGKSKRIHYYKLPANYVKRSGNELIIQCPNVDDDIYVGPIILHHVDYKKARLPCQVSVKVTGEVGKGIPCRLTITKMDEKGKEERVDVEVGEEKRELAVRRGIIYTLDGKASFAMKPGEYRIHATRGFEYGLASAELDLRPGHPETVEFRLEHEVDTPEYLAADTHMHTKTYSKHGDATVEERLVTLAGEGVEVAILTDHDHHTDLRPEVKKLGLQDLFLPVIGNEFTTKIAHFNAFPIEKDAKPASHKSKDWGRLIGKLRATPDVKVVICNHPRRKTADEQAFTNIGLDPLSGETHSGPDRLGIDAVEVLNGRGLHEDPLLVFRDWFALLNRGLRIAAVAGSDSHSVKEIVGQSRTYVRSSARKPGTVRMDDLIRSFLEGRLLMSLGLLAEVKVDNRFEVGDLATGLGDKVDVEIKVSGPKWAVADKVVLFLNGMPLKEKGLTPSKDAVVKYRAIWRIPRPARDAHLVVIATGPPVTESYWALHQDKRYLLGATNPLWIDGDGDGRYTSAREYALELTKECGPDMQKLHLSLANHDDAVAVQAASILRGQIQAELQSEYEKLLVQADKRLEALVSGSDKSLNGIFRTYLKNAPAVDVFTRIQKLQQEEDEETEKEKK